MCCPAAAFEVDIDERDLPPRGQYSLRRRQADAARASRYDGHGIHDFDPRAPSAFAHRKRECGAAKVIGGPILGMGGSMPSIGSLRTERPAPTKFRTVLSSLRHAFVHDLG